MAQAAEDCARTHALVRSGLMSVETVAYQLQALYRILEALLAPLSAQQQGTVTKALSKGWGVPAPKSKADYCASGMRLAQRLSETTKVFNHLTQRPSAGPRTGRHSDTIELTDNLA
eukprot:EG_transcript_23138